MNTHDSHETIFPADPRLTAYAFGELEGDELAHIEAAIQADPALQAAVAELRGFGGQLAAALGTEPAAQVSASPVLSAKKRRGLRIPFPLHYLATAAAAGFAVVVWLRQESAAPLAKHKQTEAPQVFELVGNTASTSSIAPTVLPPMPEVRFDQSLAMPGVGAGVNSSPAPASKAAAAAAEYKAAPAALRKTEADAGKLTDLVAESRHRRAGVAGGQAVGMVSAPATRLAQEQESFRGEVSADAYAHPGDNAYRSVAAEPLSTFSIDVDTASYANIRRFLAGGSLPPRDAVRVEELINYFPYRYAPPADDSAKSPAPFAAHLEVASAPWAPAHRLVRIGLKGRELTAASRAPANLVFLLDVSGSMDQPNKLPLVKESLRLLVGRLRPDDRVAIVTYAGNSGLALPSTPVSQKREILAALDHLDAGGSTNGAMGIHLAYDIAKANFVANGGINRVILCTDGDFNVGVTDPGELTRLVTEKAKSRVFLSVFGFGMGNFKDATLESLADRGNGAYGYIDTRREAEKVFVEQTEGTLATIAKDVKIQVEFNPARVQSYRLIGYENRVLAKEDFNNDAVDAGDIGAGHTVTALYEIVPAGLDDDGAARPAVDALKYQTARADMAKRAPAASSELLTVKIRYKAPEGDVSAKQEFPLVDAGAEFAQASTDFRFASAVAAWGMLLRDSPDKGAATFDRVLGWAESALVDDAGGYRSEFIQLVRRAAELAR